MVEPEFTRVEFICCQKDRLWLTGGWLLWICNMFQLDWQKENYRVLSIFGPTCAYAWWAFVIALDYHTGTSYFSVTGFMAFVD